MTFPIDFVIDWVDDSDPRWINKRNAYLPESERLSTRFRNWGWLKYWFRSVDINAPWVRYIHLITDSQVPDWLDINNSRLKLVDHTSYIDRSYLPTFNSNAIELSIHKINLLSNHFVFFNDDFFLNDEVVPENFFNKKGLPLDSGVVSPQLPINNSITHITTNNMQVINDSYSRRNVLKHLHKFVNLKYGKQNIKTLASLLWPILLGFNDLHIPISFQKETFKIVWEKYGQLLKKTEENKFRTNNDLNIFLMRYWQLINGDFQPRRYSFGKYYNLSNNNDIVIADILKKKHKVIVLNDQPNIENFYKVRKEIQDTFLKRYPKKSSFEI